MKYQLYPWQEECLRQWHKNKERGIVNVVTGGGKTYLALAAAKLLMDQAGPDRLRVKIVVPTSSLLTQWSSAILDFFGGAVSRRDIGLYYSGRKDDAERPFMIYVINSARYSLARHMLKDLEDGFTAFLIADECHRYTGIENQKIFEFLPVIRSQPEQYPGQYAALGLSATPELDRAAYASVLVPALGTEIYRYGFREAEEQETLCPYAAFHIALSFTPAERMDYEELSDRLTRLFLTLRSRHPALKGLKGSRFFTAICQMAGDSKNSSRLARQYLQAAYKRKHLTSDAAARISCVLKLITGLDKNARIIIFGERIRQADILYKKLDQRYPNQVARCHSGMDPQAKKLAIDRFQDGEVRILISCRALDEGFNVPSANVGIVMSSASGSRQRIQRLGRILRKYEGKDIAGLYYLYIEESSEEASYFPVETQTIAACELSYSLEEDRFLHPAYEKQVKTVMRSFRRQKAGADLLAEAAACLEQGLIRPDWILGEAYCEDKISRARTVSEKNYWICMKRIASGDRKGRQK